MTSTRVAVAYQNEAKLLGQMLYYMLTTGAGKQTLGEEYCDITQVCGYIKQWVEDNFRNHIMNETHARSLWDKLETLYASKTGNNKLFLLRQLMDIRYKEGSPISDHINDFQGVLDWLSGMGVKFDEEIQGL